MAKKEKKEKKEKKKPGILRKILIFLILVLVIFAGYIAYRTQKNGGGMQGLLSTLVGHNENTLQNLDVLQVLLMGVSTDNGGKLTDTIIIGTYDPKTQKASLLSIPRDTFVGKNLSAGTGMDKINALYQKSPETSLKKINELTGLDIKYYMVIDNQALIKLVDTIGGVEFYVPRDMKYDDPTQNLHINLKKGLQTLNGDKAEQLLRFRHGNKGETYSEEDGGDNDLGRMTTQRKFIIETAKQTLKAKNILKLKDIVDIAYEYVETNLSISTIKDYIPYAVNVNIEEIQSAVLPGASVGPPTAPYWFFVMNQKEAKKLIDELYGTEEETTSASSTAEKETSNSSDKTSNNADSKDSKSEIVQITKAEAAKIKIEILNGSGSDKALTKLRKELTAKGYKITRATTTTATSKTTIINKTDVDSKFEEDIKNILSVENVSTSSVSSSNVDITIIIGKDYK